MRLLIVDNAELRDWQFNEPLFNLISLSEVNSAVINYSELPAYQKIHEDYDAVILSGVPLTYSFSSVDKRSHDLAWIKTTNLPVLGICLGHQIIGKLFGGQIVAQEKKEVGLKRTIIEQEDPILRGLKTGFTSHMLHRASVTPPKDFIVLAHTKLCANVIMKHESRLIYGMQQHPELSPSGFKLIHNFIKLAQASAVSKQPHIRQLSYS